MDFSKLVFMSHQYVKVKKLDIDVLLCRCGYTGEDGFEISVHNDKIEKFWDFLLEHKEIKPAGLGARDSLRIEAGFLILF